MNETVPLKAEGRSRNARVEPKTLELSSWDNASWQRIQTLFHQAAALPVSEQRTFLCTKTENDADLVGEVLAMLDQDARGGSLLDGKLADIAHKTLARPDALVARTFGSYRILKLLGEGGMGTVYLAERKDLGGRVAIKFLRDAWLSPARRERFASEQRTLAQLSHPSIAQLYDAATLDDGTPYFVMEYVEGVPLVEYCRQNKCSIDVRLDLFRLVCAAVQHAHSHAVIHRDLKPSNILVRSDGTVRLLDFGIANQLESLKLEADQTVTGLRLMTPAYASPEQILGGRVGITTDVYSLGVILYELLSGALPFDFSNASAAEAVAAITSHETAKPSLAAKRSEPRDSGRTFARQGGLGGSRRALPHGHAQGSASPLSLGRSAHPRHRSLPERRAARSAARHVALPLGQISETQSARRCRCHERVRNDHCSGPLLHSAAGRRARPRKPSNCDCHSRESISRGGSVRPRESLSERQGE